MRILRKAWGELGRAGKPIILASAAAMLLLFSFARTASPAEMTLAWDANPEPDLAGYTLHYGFSTGSYESTLNVDNFTSCTLSGLNEGETYYFALKAYDEQGNVSDFSEEISTTIPWGDSDGDGLSDDGEAGVYGTDPSAVDTDGDGLTDSEELEYWEESWDADSDGDGLANIIDADSDNDGFSDGLEVSQGYDPSDPWSNQTMNYWSDYRFALTMRSDDNDAIGVMFRYQDDHNYYRFSWDRQRACRRLVKCENGQFSVLAEDAGSYSIGRAYQFEISVQGELIEIWIDGGLVFSVADPSFSRGGVALYSYYNAGSYFDDIVVEDLFSGKILLSDDFSDGDYDGWTIVDEGEHDGPSSWSAATGTLVQSSNIYTYDYYMARLGTFALFLSW